MPAHVRMVEIHRAIKLEQYRGLEFIEPQLERAAHLGVEVRQLLGTGRVWMLNSTETGGGVAEMLPRMCALLDDVGVDTRWLVLDPAAPQFFVATKSLHNMLHGHGGTTPPDAGIYEQVSLEAADSLRQFVESQDVLVVHDPQPVGTAFHLPAEHRPRLVWRCHIGVPYENEHTGLAWSFLQPYLGAFERFVFSSERYIPRCCADRSAVIHPGIDPLAHKNRLLRLYKSIGILRSAEILDGLPIAEWARFQAPVQRFTDAGWQVLPIANLLHGPVILQVSRFDRLKGFHALLPAFVELVTQSAERVQHARVAGARATDQLGRAMLVLAGPDPGAVSDDPEAIDVIEELCHAWLELPRELAARVHILRLPMASGRENALIVNALQRAASVVVQNSLEEGFGLTVTEALWKGTPVVASNVGGISMQIRPGTDGLLVDDPNDPHAVARAIFDQMFLNAAADAMAASGRRRVAEHFLVVTQVLRWLEELKTVLLAGR